MASEIDIIIKATDSTKAGIDSAKGNLGTLETGWKTTLDGIATTTRQWGMGATLGLTTPLVAGGVAAFNWGSDLDEATSKVNTLFGESSSAITSWAQGSAKDFGMSTTEALTATGTFGNMFMQLGEGPAVAAENSKKMVELAADIASFHNAEEGATGVSAAMQSAFRGEYDALQKYVPTLNAATVEQMALEQTGKDSAKQLTGLEKATAAMKLITEGAGAATGDFDRTADGAANRQRILTASFQDAASQIGQKLLPIGEKLLEMLQGAIDWFSNLSPEVQNAILWAAGLAAAIGPLLLAISGIASLISMALPVIGALGAIMGVILSPIGLVVAAIAGIVAGVAILAKAWSEDWGGIQTKTKEFVKWIGDSISGLWEGITGWFEGGVEAVSDAITGLWEGITGWFEGGVEAVSDAITGLWKGIKDWFKDGATNVGKWLSELVNNVKDFFKVSEWVEMGKNVIKGIIEGVKGAIGSLVDIMKDAAKAAINGVKDFLGIHSPSAVAAKEIGLPFAQGIGAGIRSGMPAAMRNVTNNNTWNIELVGGASAGQDVYNTVQLMSALYG